MVLGGQVAVGGGELLLGHNEQQRVAGGQLAGAVGEEIVSVRSSSEL